MRFRTALCFGFFTALLISPASSLARPDQDWPVGPPEEQGFDSAKLAQALAAIREGGLNLHSLLIIRHGMLILEAYFYPYDGRTVHELASVTKSLTTALIAIAAEKGKLDLDQPVLSFFPERRIANRDARKERITVRHLAGMSSGLECTAAHDEQTLSEMRASPDWVRFVLDLKMTDEPGTSFVYCSPGMHLLSAILQRATGMTALEFARRHLFEPLGIRDVLWDADPQGINRGWGDAFLHPRDAAKIGLLWRQKGIWRGQRIVSSEWVEASVKKQIKTGRDDDYGFGWWVTGNKGEYAAIGRGGQRVQVWPDIDTILIMTGGGVDIDDIEPFIAPALVDANRPLPANPAGVEKLAEAVAAVARPPAPKAVPALTATAGFISGRTFEISPNPFGIKSLRLSFPGTDEAVLAMGFDEWSLDFESQVGLDGVYRLVKWEHDLPLGLRGAWEDARTFVLEWDGIGNRDAYLLKLRFEEDRLSAAVTERTRSDSVALEGKMKSPSSRAR